MQNPFLKNNALQYEASINRTVLLDTASVTEDKSIEGKTAAQVFSIDVIVDEIKKQSAGLKIDLTAVKEKNLPIHLNHCLQSTDKTVRKTAEQIAHKFGQRLGIILYCIKKGKSKSADERKDWPDEGWAFWQQIENIVLSGGLASGGLGKIFQQNIYRIFEKGSMKPYQVHLTKDSSLAGLTGAAMFVNENAASNLVFDFGQSFLKGGIASFEGKVLTGMETLPKLPSQFMEWSADESVNLTKEALLLDDYLQQTILNTLRETSHSETIVGDEIVISLANYIDNGKVQYRGGYGKLRFISAFYDKHLANAISQKAGKKFIIKIIHDGTAIAANFMQLPQMASIALGTSFGVGFPIQELYHKSMKEELQILEKGS